MLGASLGANVPHTDWPLSQFLSPQGMKGPQTVNSDADYFS